MNGLLAAIAGMLILTGVFLAVRALRPGQAAPSVRRRRRIIRAVSLTRRTKALLLTGVIAGIGAALFSGVLVLAVVVPIAVVGLPLLLGRQDTRERDLLSALEAWARSLAAASATGRLTLRDVIAVTRTSTPALLRPSVDRMQHRVATTWTTTNALRAFADDLQSLWVDEVAIYLIQAAEYSSSGLAEALSGIADTLAAQVKLRAEVFKERERPRRVMIQITWITGGTLALVILFARTPQLAPYETPIGQLLLVLVLAAMTALLVWARWIGRPRPEPRFLLTRRAER